jgi:hypothetical protein
MRYNKILMKVWEEFIVEVDRGDGLIVSICGLCGNRGVIDTTLTAKFPNHKDCGVVSECICPNGRALRKLAKSEIKRFRSPMDKAPLS